MLGLQPPPERPPGAGAGDGSSAVTDRFCLEPQPIPSRAIVSGWSCCQVGADLSRLPCVGAEPVQCAQHDICGALKSQLEQQLSAEAHSSSQPSNSACIVTAEPGLCLPRAGGSAGQETRLPFADGLSTHSDVAVCWRSQRSAAGVARTPACSSWRTWSDATTCCRRSSPPTHRDGAPQLLRAHVSSHSRAWHNHSVRHQNSC